MSRSGLLFPGQRALGLSLGLSLFAIGLPAAGDPVVDGDEALRCTVARAVGLALDERFLEMLGAIPEGLDGLRATGAGGTADAAVDALVHLGLVESDGRRLTAQGERVLALASTGEADPADVALGLGVPVGIEIHRPGVPARLLLDTTGSEGQTVVVVVSPEPSEGEGCPVAFEPVVRAALPDSGGLELVARGTGPMRTATLFLHDLDDGATVELSIADVVGAPGRFDVSAEVWPVEPPAAGASSSILTVGDGAVQARDLSVDGDRVAVALSIEAGYDTVLQVRGLAGAQPGVRVYTADAYGIVAGEEVYRSSFLPRAGATVDLAPVLAPGFYVAVVEELGGHPGTFLVEYSGSTDGATFRTTGSVDIGGESLQQLNSDLSITIMEAGWYAFATQSVDDVDPMLSLLDSEGYVLQESDDDAFSLHPLIIVELQPGDYSLALDGFDQMAGEVTLGAWRIEPRVLELGEIDLNQSIAADTGAPNFNVYRIAVTANELVDIEIEGVGDFDSTLAIYDPWDMSVWIADDDGGVGLGSRIIDSFEALDLLLVVSSFDGARGGSYTISAVDHALMENLDVTAVPLSPGDAPVAGNLPGESDVAWFRVADRGDGEWHTLRVRSDTMLYLAIDLFRRQPDGYVWVDGMEAYDGFTEVGFEMDGSGDVFVLVRNTSGEGAGDFTAEVE